MTGGKHIPKATGWLILIMIFCLGLGIPIGRTESEQPKLTAPGGAEIDFARDITKCSGTASKPVEAKWHDYIIEAGSLEYYRNEQKIHGQGNVKMIQNSPQYRVITCNEIFFELEREWVKADKDVKVIYDQNTSLSGETLEWDRPKDLVKVTGSPQINYKDWTINGERIEGQINKGVFVFHGPVKGAGNDGSFKAGQVEFDGPQEKIFLKNNPVVVQGKNQFTAPEMVYDLKTRKVSTKSDSQVN